jgi:hypothetical protein
MNIARVIDGIVVNLEVADQEWIDANTPSADGAVFVPVPDSVRGHIGLGWDEVNGFEQPPAPSGEWQDAEVISAIDAALAGE